MLEKLAQILGIKTNNIASAKERYEVMRANLRAIQDDNKFKEIVDFFERELISIEAQLGTDLSDRELVQLVAQREVVLRYMNWLYNLLID